MGTTNGTVMSFPKATTDMLAGRKQNGNHPPPGPGQSSQAPTALPLILRGKMHLVDIYLVHDNETVLAWGNAIFVRLVAGSKYAEKHATPPTSNKSGRLEIPASEVDLVALRSVLRFLDYSKPRAAVRFEPGKPLEYYLKLYQAVLLLNLKAPMDDQFSLKRQIRNFFSHTATISKDNIAMVWKYIGLRDKKLMKIVVHALVEALGMEEDPTSKGSKEVAPGKSVWDTYMNYFAPFTGLTDLVDEVYMDKSAYLDRVHMRQGLAGQMNKVQKEMGDAQKMDDKQKKMDDKQKAKGAYFASGVNTITPEQAKMLREMRG